MKLLLLSLIFISGSASAVELNADGILIFSSNEYGYDRYTLCF